MTVVLSDSDKSYIDLIPAEGNPFTHWIKWAPLELTLQSYMEMIEQKRVIASIWPSESRNPYTVGETDPWRLSLDDDPVVDDSVSAWNDLLAAIESRMPVTESRPRFYCPACIDSCEIKGLFLSKFLRRARIPAFRYVAPGLRLASDEDLSNQVFKKADLKRLARKPRIYNESAEKWCYPYLFLRFDQEIHLDRPCRDDPSLTGSEFRYNGFPWQNAPDFDTGLYITGDKYVERPDGGKLLLPFPLTPKRWAKFGDGCAIHVEHAYDGLYQRERDSTFHWAMMGAEGEDVQWNVRLKVLFENWTSMIKNGHWEVGEDGVMGGAEKFREADSEDKWNLYYIERTW
jgi:hypothetical protein